MAENLTRGVFEVVKTYPEIHDENRNIIVLSHQRITNPSGKTSDHLVIERTKLSMTGFPQGYPKKIFLPFQCVQGLKNILNTI